LNEQLIFHFGAQLY